MESKINVGGHEVTGLALSISAGKHAEIDELIAVLEKGDDVRLVIEGRVKAASATDSLDAHGSVRETNGRLGIHAFRVSIQDGEDGVNRGAWQKPRQIEGQQELDPGSEPDPSDVEEARARLGAGVDGGEPAAAAAVQGELDDSRSAAQKDRVPA